jgi:hypothetical protein
LPVTAGVGILILQAIICANSGAQTFKVLSEYLFHRGQTLVIAAPLLPENPIESPMENPMVGVATIGNLIELQEEPRYNGHWRRQPIC